MTLKKGEVPPGAREGNKAFWDEWKRKRAEADAKGEKFLTPQNAAMKNGDDAKARVERGFKYQFKSLKEIREALAMVKDIFARLMDDIAANEKLSEEKKNQQIWELDKERNNQIVKLMEVQTKIFNSMVQKNIASNMKKAVETFDFTQIRALADRIAKEKADKDKEN